jgi:WD40 repeat protein
MDFTPLFRHSHSAASIFSPDSRHVLSVHRDRLVVRSAESLAVARSWRCQPGRAVTSFKAGQEAKFFSAVAFSPNSQLIAAAAPSLSAVFLFSLDSDDELGRITIGAEGVAANGVKWLTDYTIGVWSEHGLRLSVWNLAKPKQTIYIQFPKCPSERGWGLRPTDKRYLALLERHKGRDCLGVYDTVDWSLAKVFTLTCRLYGAWKLTLCLFCSTLRSRPRMHMISSGRLVDGILPSGNPA